MNKRSENCPENEKKKYIYYKGKIISKEDILRQKRNSIKSRQNSLLKKNQNTYKFTKNLCRTKRKERFGMKNLKSA